MRALPATDGEQLWRDCRPYALVEHSLAHWTSRHSGEAVPRGLLRDLLAESVAPCAVRFLGSALHASM